MLGAKKATQCGKLNSFATVDTRRPIEKARPMGVASSHPASSVIVVYLRLFDLIAYADGEGDAIEAILLCRRGMELANYHQKHSRILYSEPLKLTKASKN